MGRRQVGIIAAGLLTLAIVIGIVFEWLSGSKDSPAIGLSQIMLLGLALVVALVAGLSIIYWVLGLDDGKQALGLPEGSVRALLAFSLVLAFVCLAAFLYAGISAPGSGAGVKLSGIELPEITKLEANFVVAYEPTVRNGAPAMTSDGKSPLYDATYYPARNASADDFAKQIFTTLAAVFVSVISFYFGSSATSSGVSAGAAAVAKAAGAVSGDTRAPNDSKATDAGDDKSGDGRGTSNQNKPP